MTNKLFNKFGTNWEICPIWTNFPVWVRDFCPVCPVCPSLANLSSYDCPNLIFPVLTSHPNPMGFGFGWAFTEF